MATTVASVFWGALALALPRIHGRLDVPMHELEWTVTGAGLGFAATLILASRVGDRVGHRRVLGVALLAFAAFSGMAALATNGPMLIAACAAMGIAAAALTSVSLVVVGGLVDQGLDGGIAVWGAASAIAYGLGPLVGGVLTHTLGWPWVFWFEVPLAIVAAGLTWVALPADTPAGGRLDVRGAALLGAGLLAICAVLTEGERWGWLSALSLAVAAAGVSLLMMFVRFQRRTTTPLVDMGLLRIREHAGAAAVLLLVNFTLGALLFFVPLFLQEVRVDTPLEAGVFLLPLSAALTLAMALDPWLDRRAGMLQPLAAGLALAGVACWLLSGVDGSTGEAFVVPVLIAVGCGIGLALTPLNVTALESVPASRRGMAAGVIGTARGLGSSLGVALCGAVFQHISIQETISRAAVHGIKLSAATVHRLDGALVGAHGASVASSEYGAQGQVVLRAVREGFTSGFNSTMAISAGVALVGVIVSVAVLRGRRLGTTAQLTAP